MAFHVPFDQRRPAQQGPIYIGFEVQQPPRPKFNWWGFNGMWMSVASLMSLGFASPIPLLISLVGLRRPGKKMATIGTLTSLAGIGLAVAIVFSSIAHNNYRTQQRKLARHNKIVSTQVQETKGLLSFAHEELAQFRDGNKGNLPEDLDASVLMIKHVDSWGESLRYEENPGYAIIRSAGPDKAFNTKDDLTSKIEGITERGAKLPVEPGTDLLEKTSTEH